MTWPSLKDKSGRGKEEERISIIDQEEREDSFEIEENNNNNRIIPEIRDKNKESKKEKIVEEIIEKVKGDLQDMVLQVIRRQIEFIVRAAVREIIGTNALQGPAYSGGTLIDLISGEGSIEREEGEEK